MFLCLPSFRQPVGFQATGTTKTIGTTGTDLNVAQRWNGSKDLTNPICVERLNDGTIERIFSLTPYRALLPIIASFILDV
jgi:hypothetical protein